jgi:hypothetical protein
LRAKRSRERRRHKHTIHTHINLTFAHEVAPPDMICLYAVRVSSIRVLWADNIAVLCVTNKPRGHGSGVKALMFRVKGIAVALICILMGGIDYSTTLTHSLVRS